MPRPDQMEQGSRSADPLAAGPCGINAARAIEKQRHKHVLEWAEECQGGRMTHRGRRSSSVGEAPLQCPRGCFDARPGHGATTPVPTVACSRKFPRDQRVLDNFQTLAEAGQSDPKSLKGRVTAATFSHRCVPTSNLHISCQSGQFAHPNIFGIDMTRQRQLKVPLA